MQLLQPVGLLLCLVLCLALLPYASSSPHPPPSYKTVASRHDRPDDCPPKSPRVYRRVTEQNGEGKNRAEGQTSDQTARRVSPAHYHCGLSGRHGLAACKSLGKAAVLAPAHLAAAAIGSTVASVKSVREQRRTDLSEEEKKKVAQKHVDCAKQRIGFGLSYCLSELVDGATGAVSHGIDAVKHGMKGIRELRNPTDANQEMKQELGTAFDHKKKSLQRAQDDELRESYDMLRFESGATSKNIRQCD